MKRTHNYVPSTTHLRVNAEAASDLAAALGYPTLTAGKIAVPLASLRVFAHADDDPEVPTDEGKQRS